MEKQKSQIVTIDGVEHDANTFTEQQVLLLNHTIDLDRKIGSTTFQLQQLQVGKDSFLKLLKDALAADPAVVQDVEAVGGTD
jgi:hypothetical protein